MENFSNISTDRSLKRKESLKSKKDIQELFTESSSFYLYPFLFRFQETTTESAPQILVSVPKKKFKRAADRNLLKRRIREAYRLEKNQLFAEGAFKPKQLVIIFLGKEILSFHYLKNKLTLALSRLSKNDR